MERRAFSSWETPPTRTLGQYLRSAGGGGPMHDRGTAEKAALKDESQTSVIPESQDIAEEEEDGSQELSLGLGDELPPSAQPTPLDPMASVCLPHHNGGLNAPPAAKRRKVGGDHDQCSGVRSDGVAPAMAGSAGGAPDARHAQAPAPHPPPLSDPSLAAACGFPPVVWQSYAKYGVKQLYDWQEEVLSLALSPERPNVVYTQPTSGGKSLVAELLLLRACQRGRKALLVLPYISIVEEKTSALEELAMLVGARAEGYYGSVGSYPVPDGPLLIIATMEKANGVINAMLSDGKLHELDLVVVDELHMLGSDQSRGKVLELLLTKIRYFSNHQPPRPTEPPSSHDAAKGPPPPQRQPDAPVPLPPQPAVQILGMSATIPNLNDMAAWVNAHAYNGTFRPVPLYEFLKVGHEPGPMMNAAGEVGQWPSAAHAQGTGLGLGSVRTPTIGALGRAPPGAASAGPSPIGSAGPTRAAVAPRPLSTPKSEATGTPGGGGAKPSPAGVQPADKAAQRKARGKQKSKDHDMFRATAELCEHAWPAHSILVFCPTRDLCAQTAKHLAQLLPSDPNTTQTMRERRAALREEMTKTMDGVDPVLDFTMRKGIAYHHGALTTDERAIIEGAFRTRVLTVICCTSTLAAGVNLPARRVIIQAPKIGRDVLSVAQYRQMCGRAGRAGKDSFGESVLVVPHASRDIGVRLLTSPVEAVESHILDRIEPSPFKLPTAGTLPRTRLGHARVGEQAPGGYDLLHELEHGLSRLVLEAISLGVEDVQSYADHTFLGSTARAAPDQGEGGASSSSTVSPLHKACVQCLDYLRRGGFITATHRDDVIKTVVVSPAGPGSTAAAGGPPASSWGVGGASAAAPTAATTTTNAAATTTTSSSTAASLAGPSTANSRPSAFAAPKDTTAEPALDADDPDALLTLLWRCTPLGTAAVRANMAPLEAAIVAAELREARKGLCLEDEVHICYLLCPVSLATLPSPGNGVAAWGFIHSVLTSLSELRIYVATKLIGVNMSYVRRRSEGQGAQNPRDELHVRRFYAALMLSELIGEVSVWKVAKRYGVPRGAVQSLMQSSGAFAGMVTMFCNHMDWPQLASIVQNYARRFHVGVRAEILPLIEVPHVNAQRGRALYNKGFTTVQALAMADKTELAKRVSGLGEFPERTASLMIRGARSVIFKQTAELRAQLAGLAGIPSEVFDVGLS